MTAPAAFDRHQHRLHGRDVTAAGALLAGAVPLGAAGTPALRAIPQPRSHCHYLRIGVKSHLLHRTGSSTPSTAAPALISRGRCPQGPRAQTTRGRVGSRAAAPQYSQPTGSTRRTAGGRTAACRPPAAIIFARRSSMASRLGPSVSSRDGSGGSDPTEKPGRDKPTSEVLACDLRPGRMDRPRLRLVPPSRPVRGLLR